MVDVYEQERDHWLESQNGVRTVRVSELLGGTDVDLDAAETAIRYPLRRVHLALVLWFPDSDRGDDLIRLERLLPRPDRIIRDTGARCSSRPTG